MEHYKYIIVGAGIAGVSAIKGIREHDTASGILLISNEDRLPYKRTQLNKNIAKNFSPNDFELFDEDWYKQNKVNLLYDTVTAIFPNENKIETPHGAGYFYDKLLLALGSSPRIPAMNGLVSDDLFPVRYARQVETLMSDMSHFTDAVIVGGGIEGIETAWELHKLGKRITIIEQRSNPLEKLFPPKLSEQIYKTITDSGTQYLTNSEVVSVEKVGPHSFNLTHNHGTLKTQAILLCAGTVPNTLLAKKNGLRVNRGILVNEYLTTSVSNIFAAGDCAENSSGMVTGLWHPAEYQGFAAGINMAGANIPYKPVPYRLKTEVFGGFYFSANYHLKPQSDKIIANLDSGNSLYELYAKNDHIVGITMSNNRGAAKELQNAVAQNWPIDKVVELLHLQPV